MFSIRFALTVFTSLVVVCRSSASATLVSLVLALLGSVAALVASLAPIVPAALTVATVVVFTAPSEVLSQPYVYVANQGDGTVSVIDAATNTVLHSLLLGNRPWDIAITPDGRRAYVANIDPDTVSVIDTATNTVLPPPIPVGGGPWSVAITPNGRNAYVPNVVGHSVSVIDITTNTVIPPPIPAGESPRDIAITPDGRRAYVTNAFDNTVSVIDTATNTVLPPPLPVGDWPIGIAIAPNGQRAYVANNIGSTVSVIDTASKAVILVSIPNGNPVDVAITPDGRRAYVVNFSFDGTVSVMDTATNTVLPPPIPVGGLPRRIAITPNGQRAYVTNFLDGTVAVIDITNNTVLLAPIPVGKEPHGIAITPDILPPPPCSPEAEVYDEMQSELSHNIEVFGLGRVCTADLVGTIGVKRYLPYVDAATGRRTIATKITKLELTGTDPNCGEVKITLQPDRPSLGQVVEQQAGTCFPADSYFDVFIQVAIPRLNLVWRNCQPATMRCVVNTLPPIGCTYQLGTGFDVALYDSANLNCQSPGNPVGQIAAADHRPTAAPTPPVVIPPPARTQLHLFAASQNQWLPLTDQTRREYFKSALPVVVIVHGWNRQFLEGLSAWNELASAIAARLPDPETPAQPRVNILAWDWMEEAKGGTRETRVDIRFQQTAANVSDQSRRLARSLQQLFNTSGFTRQPIHLMGHSFGASLVAMTGIQLQDDGFGGGTYPVANVTLFDPPDRVPVINRQIINSLDRNVPLLRQRGTAVDCFSGTYNDRTYFSNVWYVVPEGGHDTFTWYQAHVPTAAEPTLHRRLNCDDTALKATVGFGASATHAPAERQLRYDVCQPQAGELDVSLVAHSADDNCTARDELIYAQYCLANAATTTPLITHRLDLGIGNDACACDVPPDLTRVRMRLRRAGGGGAGGQQENLTATFTLPLTIAAEWDYLSFTYRIEAAPSPATLRLSLQDGNDVVPLFLATSDVDLGELASSGLLNIADLRGRTVQLIFSLTSAEPDAVVELSRLTTWQGPFHANLPPLAEAGQNRAIEATGATTPVLLDASGSTDANGDPLTLVWSLPTPGEPNQNGIAAVGQSPTVELPLGGYTFTLHARDPFDGFSSDSVTVEVEHPFTRGDGNADGVVNISDAIATLTSLFLNPAAPLCKDAADTNDDGVVNITDPIALLNYLFLGTSPAPKPPTFPDVGLDPTPDLLGCNLKRP